MTIIGLFKGCSFMPSVVVQEYKTGVPAMSSCVINLRVELPAPSKRRDGAKCWREHRGDFPKVGLGIVRSDGEGQKIKQKTWGRTS